VKLSWAEWAKLYAPYLCMGALSVIGAIYGYGYRQGMRALLEASAKAKSDQCAR
jgi:hypothetical protein